jgi:hypothetical protein
MIHRKVNRRSEIEADIPRGVKPEKTETPAARSSVSNGPAAEHPAIEVKELDLADTKATFPDQSSFGDATAEGERAATMALPPARASRRRPGGDE